MNTNTRVQLSNVITILLIDSGVQGLECNELFSFQEAFQHGTD